MKTYAFYDKDGKIKKVISTTRKDIIEKNLPEGLKYVEVASNVKTESHLIKDGQTVKDPDFIQKPLSLKPPISSTRSFGVTEKEIDDCKDLESLKVLLKKMIVPKTISFGKGV